MPQGTPYCEGAGDALGVEVEAAAAFFVVQTAGAVTLTLRSTDPPSRRSLRTAVEGVGAGIWIVLFVASGISLIAHSGGGLYLLAGVMPFMFGWNVYVAWVLTTKISD